jgi:hypothetical protein
MIVAGTFSFLTINFYCCHKKEIVLFSFRLEKRSSLFSKGNSPTGALFGIRTRPSAPGFYDSEVPTGINFF